LQASLGFLQDADDLFFGESLFHCRSSLERTLHRHRTKRGEQVMRSMASVARRGNPQDLADRLDPEGVAMLINEGLQDFDLPF
ncbi:hypothetical protein QZN19_33175, partial [Burkholderia vietnamiensis]